MKNIVLAGTVGKDAVLRRTQAGDPILGFSVAVDDGYGDKKSTMWFDVALFGKRGQSLEAHLKKGTKVAVSGELSTRVHENKTYLTCKANEVTLMGGAKQAQRESDEPQRDSYGNQSGDGFDDQIPF